MILFRVTNRAGKVFSRHHLEAVARKRRQALALEHPRSVFRVEERTASGWRDAGPGKNYAPARSSKLASHYTSDPSRKP